MAEPLSEFLADRNRDVAAPTLPQAVHCVQCGAEEDPDWTAERQPCGHVWCWLCVARIGPPPCRGCARDAGTLFGVHFVDGGGI